MSKTNVEISPGAANGGVGASRLGLLGIILLSVYQLAVVLVSIYALVCSWNAVALAAAEDGEWAAVVYVTSLFGEMELPLEVVLMLIVASCGILGASLHCLRSLTWYVGNRELRRSWTLKYLMQPLMGASLALIVYFVARAGFLPAQVSSIGANFIGYAAISGIVGLFSDQAVLKLKGVAENLFTKAEKGKDSTPSNP